MGWSNNQATNLNGQAVTYTNSTTEYSTGSSLAIDSTATFTVNGLSPGLGVVGRNYANTDQPPAGTTATNPGIAATVLTTTAQVVQGRIYLVSSPGLTVRMNVAGTTGIQFNYTEDGTAPGPGSILLASATTYCPVAGQPQPLPLAVSYTRRTASGPLRVCLSIWNIGAGTATVASGGNQGGSPLGVIELIVTDLGIDPGTST